MPTQKNDGAASHFTTDFLKLSNTDLDLKCTAIERATMNAAATMRFNSAYVCAGRSICPANEFTLYVQCLDLEKGRKVFVKYSQIINDDNAASQFICGTLLMLEKQMVAHIH